MAFSDAVARDAQHIHSRDGGEFVAAVQLWNRALDPYSDDPTVTGINGTRFSKGMEREEHEEGQSTERKVLVTVTKADVASVDGLGWLSVNGEVFSIQSVSGDDDVTWFIVGCRVEKHGSGDANDYFGR